MFLSLASKCVLTGNGLFCSNHVVTPWFCPSYVPATVLGVWDSSVNHMGEALALAEFPWAWI